MTDGAPPLPEPEAVVLEHAVVEPLGVVELGVVEVGVVEVGVVEVEAGVVEVGAAAPQPCPRFVVSLLTTVRPAATATALGASEVDAVVDALAFGFACDLVAVVALVGFELTGFEAFFCLAATVP